LAATADIAAEVALIDLVPGLAESVALDLMHASGITRSPTKVIGGTGLEMVAGADVVVITAGRPRGAGMSRRDLTDVNGRVVRAIAEQVAAHAPDAVVVVVTNPLDEMTLAAQVATGFHRQRVLGMAGTLDSSRFRHQLAAAAGVTPADVIAFTLGSHGKEMVPITSTATISGRPLATVLDRVAIDRAVTETINGGAAVVALRRTGSATIAPAHAIIEVLDGIRGATAGPIPVSVLLDGEYGIEGVVVGVPCLLGRRGVIEVVELDLAPDELARLRAAADSVRDRSGV
jgi:malate dehydrogenase